MKTGHNARRFRQNNNANQKMITVHELNNEERVFFHRKFSSDKIVFLQAKENSDINVWDAYTTMRHQAVPDSQVHDERADNEAPSKESSQESSGNSSDSNASSSNDSANETSVKSSSLSSVADKSSSSQAQDSSSVSQAPSAASSTTTEEVKPEHAPEFTSGSALDAHVKVAFNVLNTTLDLALDFNEFFSLIRNFQLFREMSGGRWTKHLG